MSEGRDRLNRDEVEQERSPLEGESRVSESEAYERYHVAGFWPRFFAYIIDLITIAAISFLLVRPILSLFNIETMPFWLGSTIVYIGVIGALYFMLMTKYLGQTVGKIIFGLRVIRQDERDERREDEPTHVASVDGPQYTFLFNLSIRKRAVSAMADAGDVTGTAVGVAVFGANSERRSNPCPFAGAAQPRTTATAAHTDNRRGARLSIGWSPARHRTGRARSQRAVLDTRRISVAQGQFRPAGRPRPQHNRRSGRPAEPNRDRHRSLRHGPPHGHRP
jgi:hypothetical protein